MSSPVDQLIREVRFELQRARYDAYRRALRATGHAEKSVEIMVERDRAWLDDGDDKPEA